MTDPLTDRQEGADALFYARAVIADAPHFEDVEVRRACVVVRAHSQVPRAEKDEARELQNLLASDRDA